MNIKTLFVFTLLILLVSTHQANSANLGNRSAVMWAPYAEWSVNNSTYSGNPFDVIATVTFNHSGSNASHTTEMFFDSNNTWKFRFTGTKTGNWNFVTSSSDPDLNGHTGSVTVNNNNNQNITGFLTKNGNKFALQTGNSGTLKPFRLNIFMFKDNGPNFQAHVTTFRDNTVNKARTYARAAKNNGMSAISVFVSHNWLELGAYGSGDHSSVNPDPQTFKILEDFIATAHSEGVHTYIWAWGDEQRRWTPVRLPGGVNGTIDKRVHRYIGSRLAPLPGWSMGYGFDLEEHTTASSRNEWANYLHSKFGWDHLLSTRGFRLPNGNNINGYSSNSGNHTLNTANAGGPRSYDEILADITSDISKPSLYEERHVFNRPGFTLATMDGMRKFIWWNTLAGGMGSWFGFFTQDPVFGGDPGYPNPEQLRTASTFWDEKQRFLFNMSPAANLGSANTQVMASSDNKNYVFYKVDASSVELKLSGMSGAQSAIAVDTKRAYQEINLGTLSPSNSTWNAPYNSDWAIAVGNFSGGSTTPPSVDTTPPSKPTSLIAR